MNAIEFKNVSKHYPSFSLGPLNFAIQKGEFFGIFGPPSSGKTSILKLIAGLLVPDHGALAVEGVSQGDPDLSRRRISMVFQNLALFPHMSGRENIAFPLTEAAYHRKEIERRLEHMSSVLHIKHILAKMPAQMSGGERQRIALGRALVGDSRAILLDEPIAALDARLREEMRVELKRLQRENSQTFVYVSHDEEEVMSISDRVAVAIDGRIAQIGTPQDIYDRPVSTAVARIVGAPPMNLFDGHVTDDGHYFQCANFRSPLRLEDKVLWSGKATLGVRPEDIRQASSGSSNDHLVTVESVEPLGGYTIVNAKLGNQLIRIRASGQISIAAEYNGPVAFDRRKLHLFDGSGARR